MDKKLLDILACPACKSSVRYDQKSEQIICVPCRLAFPVHDQIPVMLVDQATELSSEQADQYR